MMRFRSLLLQLAIAAAGLSVVAPALAYESRYLVTSFGNICQNRDPQNIVGSFKVKNFSKETVQIKVNAVNNEEFQFRFVADQRLLRPEQEANVHFRGALLTAGKHQIIAVVDILNANGDKISSHQVDLYYLVENNQVRASSYEELYLKPDVVDPVRGNAFNVQEDTGRIKHGDEYQNPLPDVQRMIELDPKLIYQIPTDSADPSNCSDPHCTCPKGAFNCPEKSLKTLPLEQTKNPKAPSLLATNTVSGTFSYKGMDGLLHPAFGWRVKAWRNTPGVGWHVLAEDWIQFNGHWTLNYESGAGDIQFQYVAANRFFTPMTSAEDTYRWIGPVRTGLPTIFNEGSWLADTSGGSVRGLGEIYYQGMYLWSKLYWEGEINPLRDSSIKVYFPNTTYDCGDGTGSPWSCASKDGRIWFIPAHATRNGVIQHELSHQINYQFWGNVLPPGAGGSHSLGSCYNKGLALTEGFANFMVFWAQSGRGDDPSSPAFDFRPEDPSSFACDSPLDTNESWVAANFWDLHDTRGDSSDNLWFIHPGAVPGIFLRSGMKAGMSDFHSTYRDAANVEHRSIIDAIFKQNKIIP
jgi:hypothetical protein